MENIDYLKGTRSVLRGLAPSGLSDYLGSPFLVRVALVALRYVLSSVSGETWASEVFTSYSWRRPPSSKTPSASSALSTLLTAAVKLQTHSEDPNTCPAQTAQCACRARRHTTNRGWNSRCCTVIAPQYQPHARVQSVYGRHTKSTVTGSEAARESPARMQNSLSPMVVLNLVGPEVICHFPPVSTRSQSTTLWEVRTCRYMARTTERFDSREGTRVDCDGLKADG